MNDIEIKVISLKKSQPRRDYIAKILTENGQLNWSFFNALTPDSVVPGLEVDYDSQLDHFGRRLNGGEIGCFKSHFSVLRDFVDNGTRNWLLVLEDDVWFDTNFDLRELIDFIDRKGIDYIRLFAKMYKDADRIAMLSGFRQIVRFRSDPYGTQAYVINKRGAKAFLDGLTLIEQPIDDELGRFWRHGLEAFGVFPFPAVERSVVSSLEVERDDGQKTRSKYRWKLLAFRISEKLRKQRHNAVFRMSKLLKVR
jgi:glycosyl transferase, family 25